MPSQCNIEGCEKVRDRGGMCQMHNWRITKHGDINYKRPKKSCSIDGCERKHKRKGLCQMHAGRLKKGTPLDYVAPKLAKKRYRLLSKPDHPLADVRGRVYFHRLVLYTAVNGSRLPCFWCGCPLEWKKNLVVDHLDHDRHNNAETNLVPSCGSCNSGRTISNPTIRVSIYQRVGT